MRWAKSPSLDRKLRPQTLLPCRRPGQLHKSNRHLSVLCITSILGGNGTSAPPKEPYNVVITGSTKGVGLCLAQQFLKAGDRVVISSRSEERVEGVCKDLAGTFGRNSVKGIPCDVSKPQDVAGLADFSASELGTIDLWINNAGTNAYMHKYLMDSADDDIIDIVQTNLVGAILGCKEAIRVMRKQRTDGHIFNTEGAGFDGNPTPRIAAYGATKRALAQLNKSLVAELKQKEITNIGMHLVSPGMCTTELLMSGANTAQAKFFINCLAEPPEVAAKELVPQIRNVPKEARNVLGAMNSGFYLVYLSQLKAYSQIFKRLVSGERKGRYVPED